MQESHTATNALQTPFQLSQLSFFSIGCLLSGIFYPFPYMVASLTRFSMDSERNCLSHTSPFWSSESDKKQQRKENIISLKYFLTLQLVHPVQLDESVLGLVMLLCFQPVYCIRFGLIPIGYNGHIPRENQGCNCITLPCIFFRPK